MMQSKKFQWNSEDTENFTKKTLVQILPVALIYIGFVITQINDGFAWNDFVPTLFVQGTMVLYILNRVYDAIQRYISGK